MTFATLLDETGASGQDTRILMRHAATDLTFGRYVKARPERLQAAIERVWIALQEAVLGGCDGVAAPQLPHKLQKMIS